MTSGSGSTNLVALMVATAAFTLGEGSIGVLLSPYLAEQGLSQALIGPVVASFSVAALASRPIAGSLYRPWRSHYLVAGGCFLSAAAFLGISVSTSPAVLTALTAVNGVGFAFASTGGLAAIMDLSEDRDAGSTMGWYTGAIGVGHAVAGFLGGVAGDELGLSRAIAALAAIPLLTGVVLAVLLRAVGTAEPLDSDSDLSGTSARPRFFHGALHAGPLVWLGFAVALHINLLSGVLKTYFPLYGLAIGLTLTRIGVLSGLHSSVSSLARFIAPIVLRRAGHRRLTPWMVALGGLAVAALTISPAFTFLLVVWLVIGLSRGILRVSSAALVMESSGRSGRNRGAASGIYLAGLDIGKIVGPIVGGVIVSAWSYEGAFIAAGLGFPLVYLVLSRFLHGRENAMKQPSSA